MVQVTVWSIPPLLALLFAVGAYVRVGTNRLGPGLRPLQLLLGSLIIWCAAQLVDSFTVNPATKVLIAKLTYLSIIVSPVAWFIFALTSVRRRLRLSRRALNAIGVLPLITVLLASTNEWHQLVWTRMSMQQTQGGYVMLGVEYGTWFYIQALYAYTLVIAATTVLFFFFNHASQSLKPLAAVIAAPTVAVVTNVLYLSPWNPSPYFDFSTFGFCAAALILDAGVLRYGLLNAKPVVRELIVEHLDDPVVVSAPDGEIVDINPAALRAFGIQRLGENTKLRDLGQTLQLRDLVNRKRTTTEITLNERAYDVRATALDSAGERSDIVLVFRDVTARREADITLRNMTKELETQAQTDHLTRLYNRRFFMQRLQEEAERVRRHGSSLSVLLYDLDKFKAVNDTYGHNVGDLVLIAVADISDRIKRVTDVAARLGGEEFGLLLPETDAQGAMHLAQRLREAVEAEQIYTPEGQLVRVTTSVGVATVTQTQDADHILTHADRALYKAKNEGRNQVMTAEIPTAAATAT